MDILALLTAFGIGSAVTAFTQYILTSRASARRRTYDERKEAYIGLAEAWVRQDKEGVSKGNMLDVGHWLLRCQLVAPNSMLPLLQGWASAEPGSAERITLTDQVKSAMRKDLSAFR